MPTEVGEGPWIETYTGKHFHILDPMPDEINIEDIAHSLSMQCRFTGHCAAFFSVAEHSVIVSLLVKPEHALAGLLHDASEAYLTDVARPVKPELHNYRAIESVIMGAIFERFDLADTVAIWEDIKEADTASLMTEAKYLMHSGGKDWGDEPNSGEGVTGVVKKGKIPKCLQPIEAKAMFLSRFWELSGDSGINTGVSPIWTPGNN